MQKVQNGLSWHCIWCIEARLPCLLPHPNLLRTDCQTIVEIVLSICAEWPTRHVIPVTTIVEKDRPPRHEQGDTVLISMPMSHFLLLNGERVTKVITEIKSSVSFVAVIQK